MNSDAEGAVPVTARLRVGVLALQGDVREHRDMLASLGADVVLVRKSEHLEGIHGLVLPGGESTVIDKLARAFGVREPIRALIAEGLPVYGTCAGMILLADRVLDAAHDQQTLGGLDITVRRNAFGGQIESFETLLDVPALADTPVAAAFIRAPVVVETGPGVRVLAELAGERPVAVEQGKLLATAFHPEVTGETRFHRHFLGMIDDKR